MIELIETRVQYYASVCPMMFFYGQPRCARPDGRRGRPGRHLRRHHRRADDLPIHGAVGTGILGGPLAGLYRNRLDDGQQHDVRRRLAEHLAGLAETSGGEVLLPAEVRIVVAERNTAP